MSRLLKKKKKKKKKESKELFKHDALRFTRANSTTADTTVGNKKLADAINERKKEKKERRKEWET